MPFFSLSTQLFQTVWNITHTWCQPEVYIYKYPPQDLDLWYYRGKLKIHLCVCVCWQWWDRKGEKKQPLLLMWLSSVSHLFSVGHAWPKEINGLVKSALITPSIKATSLAPTQMTTTTVELHRARRYDGSRQERPTRRTRVSRRSFALALREISQAIPPI